MNGEIEVEDAQCERGMLMDSTGFEFWSFMASRHHDLTSTGYLTEFRELPYCFLATRQLVFKFRQ